jgi:hypothetical protein
LALADAARTKAANPKKGSFVMGLRCNATA